MRNYVSIISLFILPFVLLAGCNMGPTKRQTRQALGATFRSFISSIEDLDGLDDVQVNGIYANGADFVFENKEGSVVTAMSLFMRENELQIYAKGTVANYEDPKSDYIINGEFSFSAWYPNNSLGDAYGEISGSVDLSGGKIERLEFLISGDDNGSLEYDTTANNYPVDLKRYDYDSFLKMLKDAFGKVLV